MAIKYAKPAILAMMFLMALSPYLLAQTQEGAEPRFFQRLSWTGGEYAMKYEVIIEEALGEGRFSRLLSEFTEEHYIRVTLSPGNYRVRVIPYDFLYRPAEGSQWMNFTVIPVPGQEQQIYIGEQEQQIYIAVQEYIPQPEPQIEPVRYRDTAGDMHLSLSFMPLFTLSGNENRFLANDNTMAGAALRLGRVRPMNIINPGAELGLQWFGFNISPDSPMLHYMAFSVNFLAQRRLFDDFLFLNLRAGMGLAMMLNLTDRHDPFLPSAAMETEAFFANFGFSAKFFVFNPFFLELGVDYVHMFTSTRSAQLRPWFGLGVRF